MARRFIHPETGDELSRTEHFAWRAQAVIRTPWFVGLYTLLTLVTFALAIRNTGMLLGEEPGKALTDWWNLCSSYLAIFVESMVGLAMFAQTKRDAVILRRIAAAEEKHDKVLSHIEAIVSHLDIKQ